MKLKMKFIGPIFAILILTLMTACTTQIGQQINQSITPANGRVVMTVTDAAANMAEVTSIKITIDRVALHSDANGWVDVSTVPHTYDLLELKKNSDNALLADLSLAPTRYDQIRLYVSSVSVVDANGSHDAKLPSNALRMNGEVVVLSDKTATVSFDFIADQSLHTTGKGQYILAPVIQLETKTDATVDTSRSDDIRLSGGTVQTSSRVGMDSLGNLVVGGSLPPYLQINDDGTISGTENELITQNTTN